MKQKFWIIAVIILLVLNTAMIVFIWMNRPENRKHPMPQGSVNEFLRKELGLTPVQESQFEEERKKHFESMRPYHEAAMEKRNELFDQISKNENDTATIQRLSKELSEKESAKEVITVMHFKKLRSLLNDEQKQKFDKIFKDVLRMMSGNRPGERNGPPPRDGEGPPHEGQGPPPDDQRPPDSIQH